MNQLILTDYQDFVLKKAAPTTPINHHFHLIHASLGLATELLELQQSTDRDNTIEELGDFLWYLILTKAALNIPDGSFLLHFLQENEHDLNSTASLLSTTENFLSQVKKQVIYQHVVPLPHHFSLVLFAFKRYISDFNIPLEYLILENKNKLNKRYTTTFSQEESAKRRDKSE